MAEIGVAILAGGEATRLPNKLALAAGDVPMLVRVYRNISPGRATYISYRGPIPHEIGALLDCPMVIDRYERRGPLCGLLSTMEAMSTPQVFAVAGDAPFIDASFVDRLAAAWQPGDEAVIPVHERDGRKLLEPLAALYDRAAFLREGAKTLQSTDGSMHGVIARLRARQLPISADEAHIFANVNTQADYAAASLAWT
jgi:molybdopterin-guanine dinucleotide biosynthesis protein A